MVAHFGFLWEGLFQEKPARAAPGPGFLAASRQACRRLAGPFGGALACGLKNTSKQPRCCTRILRFFFWRRRRKLRVRRIVPKSQGVRYSSLTLHSQPVRGAWAGGSPCPAAARKAASFRASQAARGSAPTTAASGSSRIVSSPSNRRLCFSNKPNSACLIPSPTMSASGTGIGWRSNACISCWGTQLEGLRALASRNAN